MEEGVARTVEGELGKKSSTDPHGSFVPNGGNSRGRSKLEDSEDRNKANFGPWMVAQRGRWKPTRGTKGISGNEPDRARTNRSGNNHGK